MARNKLLTESEVRRFMKLASVSPVGEERLQEFYDTPAELDEVDEEEIGLEADVEAGMEDPMDEPMMDDPMDEPMDEPVEDEMGDTGMEPELEDMLAKGVEALAAAWGIEDRVDVEGDEEAALEEPEEEAPLEGGDLDELPAEMPGELEVGAEEAVEAFPGGRDMYENQDALVGEVAKRVAARLAKEHKKTEMIDTLTERIFERLTSKK